jgi:tryptophan 2,3-dioxygenase
MSRHLTDYEEYIRTDELLALQKVPEHLSCHDEMQFQIVHQVAELWMKLCEHELAASALNMTNAEPLRALRKLERVHQLQKLLLDQLSLLDTMSPKDYMIIRGALGRGSGQESPGFRRMLAMPDEVWPSFESLLVKRDTSLRQLYEEPERNLDLFLVAEALIEYDQQLQLWRQRHLILVFRQIGVGTPSLKGKPSELLAEGLKHRFFPELWMVRDELFDAWTRSHPRGADRGYHG